MRNGSNTTVTTRTGQVLEVSRRHISLLEQTGDVVTGTTSSKALELVPGDLATFEARDGRIFVTHALPASRNLYRSYRGDLKRMGANIDLLCVITAVGSTLNPVVIDRMLVAARVEGIPVVVVMNKLDKGLNEVASIFSVYEQVGVELLACSAKYGEAFEKLEQRINADGVEVVALCGVSGVGKSTILNRLIPDAQARTGDLSVKTGQGKQTTSQPRGFLYKPDAGVRRIIIDLPGVQFFGLSHVSVEGVAAAFDEFVRYGKGCRFIDCKHLQEPQCAVRAAVESGDIAEWRYESYLQILREIEDAREY